MRQIPFTIFVGSGEASVLERKVLIYSIRKNSKSALRIRIFNGTHNTIEAEDGSFEPSPMSLQVKYQNVTEFSNYRFYIPSVMKFEGKGVWFDSDMLCEGDVTELVDSLASNSDLAALPSAYGRVEDKRWGLSVSVFNNERFRIDPEEMFAQSRNGALSYDDIHQLSPRFLKLYPLTISEISNAWNSFDYLGPSTKLIHFTNLYTQPWKFTGHPFGGRWFRYFFEAREAGFISERDIELAMARSYVRRSLLSGNRTGPFTALIGLLRQEGVHVLQRLGWYARGH